MERRVQRSDGSPLSLGSNKSTTPRCQRFAADSNEGSRWAGGKGLPLTFTTTARGCGETIDTVALDATWRDPLPR